jgi:hypothetical protein
MYGYDFHKIDRLSAVDLVKYGNLYIMSTNNEYGGKPKLYFYDPAKNLMTDSLDLNFPWYGKLFLNGDELTGITRNFLYKLNLTTRRLIRKDSVSQPISYAMQLSDGRIAVNTKAPLPDDFGHFLVIPFSSCYESNNSLYAVVNGNTVIRIRNINKVGSFRPFK